MNKSLKYKLLRHLPGKWGRRYHRKYMGIRARSEFDEALNCSAGKTCIDLGANVGENIWGYGLGRNLTKH